MTSPEETQPRGRYVVIEGPEAAGKTTQVEKLVGKLAVEGIEARTDLREPGGTPMGEAIRDILLDGELPRDPLTNLYLFNAARAEILPIVKDEVEAGSWVVSDRNHLSSRAYQVYGEGVDVEVYGKATKPLIDIINPDITFVLMVSGKEQKRRLEERGDDDYFEAKGSEFHRRVRQAYTAIPHARTGGYLLDGEQSRVNIHNTIWGVVQHYIGDERHLDSGASTPAHAELYDNHQKTKQKYREQERSS